MIKNLNIFLIFTCLINVSNIHSKNQNFDKIVKIENQTIYYNYKAPWNTGNFGGGIGTGFLVGKNLIMTNAHVVSNSSRLVVRKYNDSKIYEAKIKYIAHDCDLALLELEDKTAFDGIEPFKFGDLPKLESTVTALGYPIGGKRISVTKGVVSRIDFQIYSHTGMDYHLAIQIDAAINPGNSGGPVLQDEKVVGVAFQSYSGAVAQNTGYMIPTPVVKRFLKDVEDGKYDRYVDLGVKFFNLQNPAMRSALKLEDNNKGYLITKVFPGACAYGILKEGDVIMKIDGKEVSNDGFVWIDDSRINLNEIVERKFSGDSVSIDIIREGKNQNVSVILDVFRPYLLKVNQYGKKPNFVQFAGLIFQPLTQNLYSSYGFSDLSIKYFYSNYYEKEIFKERPQVIILTNILPDKINTQLTSFREAIVDEINGKKIRTIKDVYSALYPTDPPEFFVIKLYKNGRPLVFRNTDIEEANQRIIKRYNLNKSYYISEEKPEYFVNDLEY